MHLVGFGVADAAHIAFAEKSGTPFISCDDRLIKKCLNYKVKIWCGNPVIFCAGGIKMRTIKYMDEETVIKKAMQVLIKELGPVEAIRFITIPKSKRIESVKRHREWQKMLCKDIFFDEVFADKST